MKKTFGFIGTGNMGGALAKAAARAGTPLVLADRDAEKAAALAAALGGKTGSVAEAAGCDFVFLGVKPQMLAALMQELAPVLAARKEGFVLVSMAAGIPIRDIRKMAGADYPVIRIMPNIPVAVGSGTVMYDTTDNVSGEMKAAFTSQMANAGLLDPLPESLMDAGSAVAGCGPAFAAMFAEALADGSVRCGLPRQKALQYAAQMLLGSASLLLETGDHPGQLKDAVCSPGGSTIAGVQALEESGFRGAAMDAVLAAYQRTLELGK